MARAYEIFVSVVLVVLALAVGYLSGYVVGFNDRMCVEIVKYRKGRI